MTPNDEMNLEPTQITQWIPFAIMHSKLLPKSFDPNPTMGILEQKTRDDLKNPNYIPKCRVSETVLL